MLTASPLRVAAETSLMLARNLLAGAMAGAPGAIHAAAELHKLITAKSTPTVPMELQAEENNMLV